MKQIKILDKEFKLYIPYEKIRSVIENMADKMNSQLAGKNPLFICMLNGSFMFAAELFKYITLMETEITFVKLSSYDGIKTTGNVKQLIGLNDNIEGRTVVILEDIVDTGLTIDYTVKQLQSKQPDEIIIATLFFKPDALVKNVQPDYVGMEITDDFIVGFGLDYNNYGRNLLDIYSAINQ